MQTSGAAIAAPAAFLVVGPNQGRTPNPLNVVGEEVLVKLSSEDTNNRMAFFHLTVPPLSGPPLHRHSLEDELFYVIEGELTFEIDGRRTQATAGATVFAKRLTVHTYQNFTGGTATLLIVVTPAGVDRLFEELSAAASPTPDPVLFTALCGNYGVDVLGPPL